jgi:hypothetical protein
MLITASMANSIIIDDFMVQSPNGQKLSHTAKCVNRESGIGGVIGGGGWGAAQPQCSAFVSSCEKAGATTPVHPLRLVFQTQPPPIGTLLPGRAGRPTEPARRGCYHGFRVLRIFSTNWVNRVPCVFKNVLQGPR